MSRAALAKRRQVEAAYSGDFLVFWAAYPRKVKKLEAALAWASAKPELATVLAALAWQTKSPEWVGEGGAYIPHPTTYLNQRRWEDERSQAPLLSAQEARSADAVRRFMERGGRDAFSTK
jgi:hypothetical protein